MPRRKRNMWARFTQAVTDFWFKVKFTRVTFRVYLREDDYLDHKYERGVARRARYYARRAEAYRRSVSEQDMAERASEVAEQQ